ncbi:MAG: hypothetical protein ABR526_11160 [Chthoniobacterales bacterium]
MKPTLLTTETSRRSLPARRNGSPKTDYQFRPNAMADFAGRCHGNPEPSFRGISRDYFQREARGHFVSEAAIFVLMALTAAVPVIQGARVALTAWGLL